MYADSIKSWLGIDASNSWKNSSGKHHLWSDPHLKYNYCRCFFKFQAERVRRRYIATLGF